MEKGEIFRTPGPDDLSNTANGVVAPLGPDETTYCGFREFRDDQGNLVVEVLIRKPKPVQNGQGEPPVSSQA